MYFLWFLLISGKQIWGRRVRVQHPGSGAAYKFLSRLKQICECQVWTTLYTLHSQFIDSMSTNSMFQLVRLLTCSGAVPVLRLLPGWPAAEECHAANLPQPSRPVGGLDKNSWEKLNTFYRNTNPVFRNRRLVPIADFLTAEMIKNELERANHFGRSQDGPGDVEIEP